MMNEIVSKSLLPFTAQDLVPCQCFEDVNSEGKEERQRRKQQEEKNARQHFNYKRMSFADDEKERAKLLRSLPIAQMGDKDGHLKCK